MAKRYMFGKRRKRFSLQAIALTAAASALIVGFFLHWNRPAFQGTALSNSQKDVKQDIPQAQENVPQLNLGLNKVITQLQQEATEKVFRLSVPERFQGIALRQVDLSEKQKVIALTFDDGPWPRSTSKILEILKKNEIKATFFMLGEPVKEYPQIAQQVVSEGHVVGNHTWHHWYHKLDSETAAREIEDTASIIYQTTGVRTSLFRPPGGILDNGPADYAKKQNYFVALWSDDSLDYRRPNVEKLVKNVLKNAKSGGIVLMHDGGGDRSNTVKALPKIIAELKKRDYKFVTVPELLEIKDQELESK